MATATENHAGDSKLATTTKDHAAGSKTATTTGAKQVEVRLPSKELTEHLRIDGIPASPPAEDNGSPRDEQHRDERHTLAMFCFEEPDSAVGRFVTKAAHALAKRRVSVHIFSRRAFKPERPEIRVHPVGVGSQGSLIEQVNEFTHHACNSFLRTFQGPSEGITLMGHEWSAIPAISLLHGIKNIGAVVSMHSMERQRSALDVPESKWIEETELSGLREAKSIIVHDPGTADLVATCLPDCREPLVNASPEIPLAGFEFNLDPAEVKGRFQVGPVDPTILYIGDFDQRYGPNLLMKAMPAILKQQGQARCILVGDGELLWPLRVYSRYLLLDHAVRMAGHLSDQALYELIHAADVIVVPSMDATPWWPIEAAWAASRPVVATAEAATALLEHQHDCIVVEPNERDLAEGIHTVLSNPELARAIGRQGNAKLQQRYSENKVIARIEEAIGIEIPA